MTPEPDNRLAELTQKLGVSADRVWAALVRQAPYHAVYDAAIGFLFLLALAATIAGWRAARRLTARNVGGVDLTPFGEVGSTALAAMLSFGLAMAIAGQAYEAWSDWQNSDRYAAERLTELLRP